MASTLPYEDMYEPKLKLAMRIGGEYRLTAIGGRHWQRFAELNHLDPEATLVRIKTLAGQLPDALHTAATDETVKELPSALPARLVDRIADRARRCRQRLTDGGWHPLKRRRASD